MVKLIVTDMDNTLILPDKTLPKGIFPLISRLYEKMCIRDSRIRIPLLSAKGLQADDWLFDDRIYPQPAPVFLSLIHI